MSVLAPFRPAFPLRKSPSHLSAVLGGSVPSPPFPPYVVFRLHGSLSSASSIDSHSLFAPHNELVFGKPNSSWASGIDRLFSLAHTKFQTDRYVLFAFALASIADIPL